MSKIQNKFLAKVPTLTLKGNNTGATTNPTDLTVSQVNTMLGTLVASNNLSDVVSAATSFKNISPLTTAGDIIYENATPTPARLAIGTTGQVLTVSGGLPVWAAVSLASGVSGVLPIANGGTNTAGGSYTTDGVLYYDGTEFATTAIGIAGFPLTSNGSGAPTFQKVSLTAAVTGSLPIAYGGTSGTSVATARTALGIEGGASFITTTGSSNYTTPSTITTATQFKFTLVGGGASGGGSDVTAVHVNGGGGGAVCILYISGLSPSTNYAINIGAATTGGASASLGSNGNNTTLVIASTTYTAGGGVAAAALTGNGGAGGTATGGTINISGMSGGPSMSVLTSGGFGGGHSAMLWGAGGTGNGPSMAAAGNPGTNYGGGGGGASSNGGNSGGGGAQGCILVEWSN